MVYIIPDFFVAREICLSGPVSAFGLLCALPYT